MPLRRPAVLVAGITALVVVGDGDGRGADRPARAIHGHVYVDADRDGVRSPGDPPVAGVRVWLDGAAVTVTDAAGAYWLEGAGEIVWAQTPDGHAPGPVWRAVGRGDDGPLDLALVPGEPPGPLRFVVTSDAHVGKSSRGGWARIDGAALGAALAQALDLEPAPGFFVMTGDLTNRAGAGEMAEAARALRATGVPFVPVAGNHDWLDGGARYRRHFGPPSYSFDLGGVHFVILDDNPRRDPDLAFLRRDLEAVTDGRIVVAFSHRPPKDVVLVALEAAGVDYLFTGHWHANRYARSGRLVEIVTEPIVRGGLDFTPAGYRVVTIRDREVRIDHHAIVDRPVAAIVWPGEVCVPPGPLRAIAAVEVGPSITAVRVSLDDGAPIALAAAGGWAYAGEVGTLSPGRHRIALEVTAGRRVFRTPARTFETCADASPPAVGAWLQHQAGADHHGAAARPIRPPLRALWATAVGGHLQGGSAAIADGRVFVPVVDLADGTRGGVVALDAHTGAELWRHTTGHAVRNTPAIAGGTVVIPSNDGVIHAVDAGTGAPRWRYDLGRFLDDNRAALTAAPTIADGVVYVGVIGHLAAIDLGTGRVRWRRVPAGNLVDQHSYGAAAVAGGTVIAPFGLGEDGVVAWDTHTGVERWRLDRDASYGVHAAPVVDGDHVLIVNSRTVVHAVAVADGRVAWTTRIDPIATGMSMASAATPVLAGRLLIVPTQYDGLAAVDLDRRQVRWRARVGAGVLHVAHNQNQTPSIPGSPALAGDVLWVGAADGVLRALDPATGRTLWRTDLGAPVLSGIAPAGDVLFVGTFDGTLRAFAADPTAPPIVGARAPEADRKGAWGVLAGALVGIGLVGAAALVRTRRRVSAR